MPQPSNDLLTAHDIPADLVEEPFRVHLCLNSGVNDLLTHQAQLHIARADLEGIA